jgi:transcriptional regulator with XRE-family HTH domain
MRTPVITLGNRLALARESAGISVQSMADQLGIDRRTVGRYEHDARDVPVAVVYAYAGICDVSIEWLEGRTELAQVVHAIRCMSQSPSHAPYALPLAG